MEPLSFENADIEKINHQPELENRFNFTNWKPAKNGKQTTLSDFI